MSFGFRIGRSTVSKILKETCEVLWDTLQQKYVSAPSCENDWIAISRGFEQIWNFPHCIGMCHACMKRIMFISGWFKHNYTHN